MPFADLESMSLSDYIAQEAAKDSFWFFMHIPKTAGSSFSSELASKMRPYRNIHVDYTRTDVSTTDQMGGVIADFVTEMKTKEFRSASGHVVWGHYETLRAARPDCRVVTFMRDPIARVISDYRYQRTPMHPPHQEFMKEFPTLESYVASPASQNKTTLFMTGSRDALSPEELIARIGQEFTFIGLLEMYPLSFSSIFGCMGHKGLMPTEHKRKTPDTKDTQVEVTPAMREMIREVNQMDQAAYSYVQTVLRRHRDAIWAAKGRPPRKA